MGNFLRNKKITKKGPDTELVGTHVSTEEASSLSLFCLAKGVSKSEVLRTMFAKWLERIPPEEELLFLIAERAVTSWKMNRKKTRFNTFISDLKNELIDKGISAERITTILTYINDEKEKN